MKIFEVLKYLLMLGTGLFLLWVAVGAVRGYYGRVHVDSAPGDNETYAHKLARYRASADAGVLATCTNYIVGLRSIIQLHTDTYDENFMKWTASATVEYINPVGGVERTNMEFKTASGLGDLRWFQK